MFQYSKHHSPRPLAGEGPGVRASCLSKDASDHWPGVSGQRVASGKWRVASEISSPKPQAPRPKTPGYTLVEILVATTLALLLMGAVVVMFGRVGESVTDSRAMLEAADRLRLAQARLQMDLAGITVTMNPPRNPANNEGYFEYIEGPVGSSVLPSAVAVNIDNNNQPDTTIGDFDDILMFTTRSTGKPFVGHIAGGGTIQSDVAEVAWFLRGRTLHRRMLLVAPNAFSGSQSGTNFYANNDISVRPDGSGNFIPNTLGDLTRRECRYAHWWPAAAFPYDVRNWHWTIQGNPRQYPTLPTLGECSAAGWAVGHAPMTAQIQTLDFWTNVENCRVSNDAFATGGARIADDVILTNVIGFDVKAWDPDAGEYVDLGYQNLSYGSNTTRLGHLGANPNLAGSVNIARVYDTWSTSHFLPTWNDGLDNDGNGLVDDELEKGPSGNPLATAPPYPVPLRGIQVRIRVFEPDSKQIREVTVVQEFLPR
jgi:type II secretory pathway component PulJ